MSEAVPSLVVVTGEKGQGAALVREKKCGKHPLLSQVQKWTWTQEDQVSDKQAALEQLQQLIYTLPHLAEYIGARGLPVPELQLPSSFLLCSLFL